MAIVGRSSVDLHKLEGYRAQRVGLVGAEPVDQAVYVLVVVMRLGGHDSSVQSDCWGDVGVGCQGGRMTMWLTHDPQANALLERDPLALLTGMLLNQHIAECR